MEHKPFYIVYFNTLVRIKTLKDFLNDSKCHINKAGPYGTKNQAIQDSANYPRPFIFYNAKQTAYLDDAHHADYDNGLIRILALWAKTHLIWQPKLRRLALESIPEENEYEIVRGDDNDNDPNNAHNNAKQYNLSSHTTLV
jgi:hypothetical protein